MLIRRWEEAPELGEFHVGLEPEALVLRIAQRLQLPRRAPFRSQGNHFPVHFFLGAVRQNILGVVRQNIVQVPGILFSCAHFLWGCAAKHLLSAACGLYAD